MKRIKLYIFSAIILTSGLILFFSTKELKADNCCEGGRCTGSANCHVCSNCSRCAHCGAGGTCGVCATYSTPTPKSSVKKIDSGSKNTTPSSTYKAGSNYVVNTKTLNVRSAPSTTSSVIYTLKQGEKVVLIKVIDDKWLHISVNKIKGYVSSQFVSTIK